MIRRTILSCVAASALWCSPISAQGREYEARAVVGARDIVGVAPADSTEAPDTLPTASRLRTQTTLHPALIPRLFSWQVKSSASTPQTGPAIVAPAIEEAARPDGGAVDSGAESEQEDEVWRDAWGQPKNPGLAIATAHLANFVPWAFNEIVPGRAALKISQISPTSWLNNIKHGFAWDDNAFSVNFFAHPFQGNMYFNAARSNGYGYWTGLGYSTVGSLMWECCGETHLMSINDWYNTAIGGAAFGEMLYRTSSMVLDNTATGSGRAWREVGGFLLNPMRGFNRLVTGNASRVYANPEDRADRIPERMENILSFGARVVGEGQISDSTSVHGFLDMQLISGSLLHLERQKPFDFFSAVVQLNFSEKTGLGKIEIRGNLWHKNLAETESVVSKLILVQDFDYDNNNAYEFGGQGVSLMYLRRSQRSERSALVFNAAGTLMLMGAVNSEFSGLADVEGIRERLREYDFGSGPGARFGFQFLRDGYRWIETSYRFQYLNTLNGSSDNGDDADHIIQKLRAKIMIPIGVGRWGVGADFEIHLRDSTFDFEEVQEIRQRNPQWRFFVTWNPTRAPAER